MSFDREYHRWLDLCGTCEKQQPLKPKKRCELWYGLATHSQIAIENMASYKDETGACKMYEPKEVK